MKKLLFILLLLAFAQPAFAGYTGYSYRASLTIPFGWFGTDLANFPVLITASSVPAALFDYANADGGDIRFSTDTAGDVPLNRQIVAYSNVTDTMEAWVKVPSVSSTTDTVIYIWYGNAGASEPAANDADEGSQGVWDANFKGVYHLQEAVNTDPGGYKDSTSNLHHLTGVSMALDAQPGKWGGLAAEFDGSADYISTTTLPASDYPLTLSAWMNADVDTAAMSVVTLTNSAQSANYFQRMLARGDIASDPISAESGDTTSNDLAIKTDFATATWHHVAAVFAGATSRTASLDGVAGLINTASHAWATMDRFNIGAVLRNGSLLPFNGKLDEVRVSDSARSAPWLLAEYNSSNVPGDIVDGAPVALGVTAPTFSGIMLFE